MHDPDTLLESLIADYAHLAPQYQPIMQALADRGGQIINDHVALRTLDLPELGIAATAEPFVAAGWRWTADHYDFPAKHLRARYLQPPRDDLPRVFISELILDEIDPALAAELQALVQPYRAAGPTLPGCPWQVTQVAYERLAAHSEYAGWFAACGWRVNHVTVAVHRLQGFASFADFMGWVEAEGYAVNTSGGRIKGSPAVGLEQGSTMAPAVTMDLADAQVQLPGCYVEFAWRHPLNGQLYDGFIASSADKIFESTDRS